MKEKLSIPSSISDLFEMNEDEMEESESLISSIVSDVETLSEYLGLKNLELNHTKGSMYRIRVNFTNGYAASIIYGKGSFGYERNLVEVAVMYDGEMLNTFFNGELCNGHVSPSELLSILLKLRGM